MLKHNERIYNNAFVFFDILLSLIAFYTAYLIRVFAITKHAIYADQYLLLGVLIIPTWYILLKILSIQSSRRIKPYSVIFIEYSLVILIGIFVLFIYIFAFKLDFISRIAIFIFGFINLLLIFSSKALIIRFTKHSYIKGKNVRQIILIVMIVLIAVCGVLCQRKT